MTELTNGQLISVNYFTSTLSYYFATLLVGGDTSLFKDVKYMYMFNGSPDSILTAYETGSKSVDSLNEKFVARSRVRIADNVRKEDDRTHHYASLISTFDGTSFSMPKDVSNITLALVCNSHMFIVTQLDNETCIQLSQKLRVDIEWLVELT